MDRLPASSAHLVHPFCSAPDGADLHKLVLSKAQAATLVHDNQEVFLEAIRAEVTKDDIVALGYRKKQLGVFSQLLTDPEFFELCKKQKSIKGDDPWNQAMFRGTPRGPQKSRHPCRAQEQHHQSVDGHGSGNCGAQRIWAHPVAPH